MRLRLLLSTGILAGVLTVAGCGSSSGGSSSAPSAKDLAASTAAAVDKQSSVHYTLDATINAKTSGKAATTGSILPGLSASAITSKPIKLNVAGDVATDGKSNITALTAKGTATLGGQNFDFEILADQHAVYLNVLGAWYGSTTTGLGQVKSQVPGASSVNPSTTSPDTVKQDFDQAFNAKVTDGPTLDGTKTWQITGTLNPAGIAKLAKTQAKSSSITPAQITQLQAIAPALKVVLDVGQSDSLPRELDLTLNLTSAMIAKLATGAEGASLQGLKSLDVDLTAMFSDWGKKVTITPPASYQPLEKLLGTLLGGSLGNLTK